MPKDLFHPQLAPFAPNTYHYQPIGAKVGVRGITPPAFLTQLSPEEERGFQNWSKSINFSVPPIGQDPKYDNSIDYDYRGFYRGMQNGDPATQRTVNAFDNLPHFSDKWKTPNHKTFSNESIYATHDAPAWQGDRLIDKAGNVIADETPQMSKYGDK